MDVVITDPQDVLKTAPTDFLVSHYHPKDRKGKFHIMLVDKREAVRIDLFPLRSNADKRLQNVMINNEEYSVLSAEDLTCHLLSNCLTVLENKTVDPKYFINMLSLFPFCNHVLIRTVWSEYSDEQNFDEAYWSVVSKIKKHPELLQVIIYSQDLNLVCDKCKKVQGFPLATNQEVFDLLGYV